MKNLLALLSLILLSFFGHAQNFNFGATTYEENEFDHNKIDSNANAIVLKEFGTASIQISDRTGNTELVFDYHVKIKIYNKEGYKQANIIIPMYRDDNREETIESIRASTFNLIDGKFVESIMDRKAIFNEVKSRYQVHTKFTLPNIKDGSIIEYSYRLISPNLFNFRSWEFQGDIPKVSSEYLVYIPAIYNYNVSLPGFQKLSDQKTELAKECLRISGTAIDCSKITYAMKNVPAFIEEEFMTAPSNFRSAIHFELSEVQMLTGGKQSYTKTWKDVDYDLTGEKSLGSQMKRKDLLKDLMPAILKGSADDLAKAKAVFEYIKKQIKWNNYYGKYSENNIKKALDMRSGNVADINLSLIAALSAANLNAEAVILSTRDNGTPNKLYPVMSDFNYVVAKVNIGDKSYLLDATEPLLPFGLLPLRCINDQGRVINLKQPSYWIDMVAGQKTSTSYVLNGELQANGKIKGKLTTHSQGYSAYKKRKEIKSFNSIEEFVEKLDERMPKVAILSSTISNLDSVENALTETYEVEFDPIENAVKDQLYFSPFFINLITKNPFNLNERMYPVDLGASSDERVIISLKLPGQYDLAEKPADMAISLPNSGGKYLTRSLYDGDTISFSQVIQLNKAIYESEEYPYLKSFYSKIIQNQKTAFLLKKAMK